MALFIQIFTRCISILKLIQFCFWQNASLASRSYTGWRGIAWIGYIWDVVQSQDFCGTIYRFRFKRKKISKLRKVFVGPEGFLEHNYNPCVIFQDCDKGGVQESHDYSNNVDGYKPLLEEQLQNCGKITVFDNFQGFSHMLNWSGQFEQNKG